MTQSKLDATKSGSSSSSFGSSSVDGCGDSSTEAAEEDESLDVEKAKSPIRELWDAGLDAPNSPSGIGSFFIGYGDPAAVAAEPGASGSKLIKGKIVGSLQFESRDRERAFLSEASASFCFLLMEKRLMKTGYPTFLTTLRTLL